MIFSMFSFFIKILKKPIFRIFISLSVLCILFSILHPSRLWQTIKQVPAVLWIFAVVSTVAIHFVGVIKWSLLINTTHNKLSLFSAFRCYFAGLFANLFLPSMTGGDIVRAGLAIKLNKEKEAVILGSIMDRIIDAGALALIVFCGILMLPKIASMGVYKILLSILILLLSFGLFCVILYIVPIPDKIPKFIAESIHRFRCVIVKFIKSPWRVLVALCAAIIIQVWFVILFSILGKKIGIQLSLPVWFIIWPTAKLSAMLPISLGGLGVREAALVILLGQFQVADASSMSLGLLWEALFWSVAAFGGFFYFISMKNLIWSNLNVAKEYS